MKGWLWVLVLCGIPGLTANAIEINGTVRSATDKYATVITDSDLVPTPGDKVEIYFKLPGADAEISVANGHVYEITGANIMVEIEKTTGAVAKDQLARITSEKPQKRRAASRSQRPQPAADNPSLVGKWVGRAPNGDKVTYVFKPDDTVLWTVDSPDFPGTVSAKYVVDYSTTPMHVDILDFGLPSLKDFVFLGIIQFDNQSRLRLHGEPQPPGHGKGRPKAFGDETIVFTRVQ